MVLLDGGATNCSGRSSKKGFFVAVVRMSRKEEVVLLPPSLRPNKRRVETGPMDESNQQSDREVFFELIGIAEPPRIPAVLQLRKMCHPLNVGDTRGWPQLGATEFLIRWVCYRDALTSTAVVIVVFLGAQLLASRLELRSYLINRGPLHFSSLAAHPMTNPKVDNGSQAQMRDIQSAQARRVEKPSGDLVQRDVLPRGSQNRGDGGRGRCRRRCGWFAGIHPLLSTLTAAGPLRKFAHPLLLPFHRV